MSTSSLELLMDGYFHQDWLDDYGTLEATTAAFIGEEPHDDVVGLIHDVTQVLDAVHGEPDLESHLRTIGSCVYLSPDGPLTYERWLRDIRDQARVAVRAAEAVRH